MGQRVSFGANGQTIPPLTGDDLTGTTDDQRPDFYDASAGADTRAKAIAFLRSELRAH